MERWLKEPTRPRAPVADPAQPGATKPEGAPPPGKLTLIGAGHVFRIEETIRGAIQALRPDVVCVELDRGRLDALAQRARTGTRPEPSGGFVHKKLAAFQESVAGMYGADVGSEMLAAVNAAQDVGARLALIDDPAERTLRRALRELTIRERVRVLGMLVASGFGALLPRRRRNAKATIENELRRYQEDPEALLSEVRTKFPTIYRVVIAERDSAMARRIRRLLATATHAVAVVGDGHVNGMLRELEDMKPTTYRLADVRAGRLPKPGPTAFGTPSEVQFGFEWRT
jgi:pheromone shutdown protein TraB